MIRGSEILLFLAVKYQGDWEKIFDGVKRKERITEEEYLEVRGNLRSKYVTLIDDEYPQWLKNVFKPPFCLFYHGDISLLSDPNKNLSVVGSRDCSDYSKNHAYRIISELKGQFNIVSGLAIGIDSIAHQAAIDSGAKTIAVLASGINYIYPKTNAKLYQEIRDNHLVISEYPNDLPPQKEFFPFRNRIITGLSWGVFIPEVRRQSGTFVSVGHACSQNKDVLVLPQPVGNGTANNVLISEGACLIENGSDILHEKN